MFSNQFILSFIYVVIYLIIKNTQMTGNLTKAQNLFKPYFVYIVYASIETIGVKYGGSSNPTINFISYIWSLISFNYGDDITTKNVYDENHYGRYAWIYILAPVVASIFAGIFAGKHSTQIESINFRKQAGVVGI